MAIEGSGRMRQVGLLTLVSVGLWWGCTNGDRPVEDGGGTTIPPDAAEEAAPPSTPGSVTFVTSTGGARSFEHIDSDGSYYTRVASLLLARPEPAATEQIMLVFSGIDLKGIALPAELPPPPSSPPARPPISIGISYTDPSGTEWSGPARIHVESLGSDGILEGTFVEAVLPHTDRSEPDLVLTQGRFRGRITPPF